MLVHSSPTKSATRLAHDVIYTCVTQAGLAHDVTDTDRQAQNSGAHGRVSAMLKR